MSNFISDYLNKLRVSDEKTKHRSAITISIVISAIILLILFFIFKDRLLGVGNPKDDIIIEKNEMSNIEPPTTSFINFFKETGNQFSNIKSTFGDLFNKSKEFASSTNSSNISTE